MAYYEERYDAGLEKMMLKVGKSYKLQSCAELNAKERLRDFFSGLVVVALYEAITAESCAPP